MKFVMESFMGKGASIKRKLFKKRSDQIKELVNNLNIDNYSYFRLRLIVANHCEEINHVGVKEDTYIIEYKYPIENFKKVPLKDKNDFLTELIMKALVSFYEIHDRSVDELLLIKEKFIK